MSWYDFLFPKGKQGTTVSQFELKPIEEKIFMSFDKTRLTVVGGPVGDVSSGKVSWAEEVDLTPYESKTAGEEVGNLAVDLEQAINDLKHRLEGGEISVSLPVEGVFTKNLSIPKSDLSEKVLQSEMKKFIPIPFSEVMFAYNKVGETDKQESYFCVVIQKTLFNKYVNVFKNYGMQPYFELEFFSLARLLPESLEVSVLLFVGRSNSFMILVKNKTVLDFFVIKTTSARVATLLSQKYNISLADSRILLASMDKLKESGRQETLQVISGIQEQAVVELAQEASQTIVAIEQTHGIAVRKLFAVGDVDNLALAKEVAKTFGDKISVVNPLATLGDQKNSIQRYTHHIGLAKHAL
jgi:Tfp pilus assembly PilM family ATPase